MKQKYYLALSTTVNRPRKRDATSVRSASRPPPSGVEDC